MGILGTVLRKNKPKDELTYTRENFGMTAYDSHEILTFSKVGHEKRMRVHAMLGSRATGSMLTSRFAVDVVDIDGETDRSTDIIIDAPEIKSDERIIEIATQAAELAFTLLGEENNGR